MHRAPHICIYVGALCPTLLVRNAMPHVGEAAEVVRLRARASARSAVEAAAAESSPPEEARGARAPPPAAA